jgi:hypothetical protein
MVVSRVVRSSPVILAGLVLAPMLVGFKADPDLWGHTRFGLDILESRSLPKVDPYSFTQDVSWINHEWLSELLMGAAYHSGGTFGLVLLRAALLAGFIAVCWWSVRSASVPVMAGTALVLAWGTASVTQTLRPQLWTLLFVGVLSAAFLQKARPVWLVGLPILFVVWVNTHGGWLVGAGMLGVWAIANGMAGRVDRRLLVGLVALVGVATLANPYGWGMWDFLARTVRFARNVDEWQPLFTKPVVDWIPWLVAVLALIHCTWRKRLSWDRLAVLAVLAYASVRVSRIAPLFVTAAAILLQPSLSEVAEVRPAPMPAPSMQTVRVLLGALLLMAVISALLVIRVAQCISISGPWIPDRRAAAALVQASANGTIVTWFNWGQYALWHAGPRLRVSMDGRRETIYSESFLDEHFELYRATPRGQALFRRLNPDVVWLPSSLTDLREWLPSQGYRIDVQTAGSFIAVREDRPRIAEASLTTPACFPGP